MTSPTIEPHSPENIVAAFGTHIGEDRAVAEVAKRWHSGTTRPSALGPDRHAN